MPDPKHDEKPDDKHPDPTQPKPTEIKTIRDAREGDPGFMVGADQVVITLKDGTTKTVLRTDVKDAPKPGERR